MAPVEGQRSGCMGLVISGTQRRDSQLQQQQIKQFWAAVSLAAGEQ